MDVSSAGKPSSDSTAPTTPGFKEKMKTSFCKKPSKCQIIRGTIVLLGLTISGVGSAFSKFDDLFVPEYQPAGIAFSIWGLIYTWIGIMGIRLFLMDSFPKIDIIIGFLTTGLVGSAVWAILSNNFPVAQSPVLYFCWLCAVISTALIKSNLRTLDGWLMSLGPALFAGWLSLASGLSLGIAGHAKDVVIGPWALLPTGVIAAVASVYSGTPGTSIPFLWAVGWSNWNLYSTYVVLVVGILALIGSLIRGFSYKKHSDYNLFNSNIELQKSF